MNRSLPLLMAVGLLLHAQPASAQEAEQQVLELNQQAMEAYMNLDIEGAKGLLIEALTIAERAGLEGRPLARTYINLGVVTVGGEQDQQSAFEFFKAALDADPGVWPDPGSSTPEVDEAFELARGRYEMETGTKLPSRHGGSPEDFMAGLDDDASPAGGGAGAGGDTDGDPTADYDFGEQKRTFVQVGFSIGAATVGRGRVAAPQPGADCYDESGALRPECQSYVFPSAGDCSGPEACVRVAETGLLPVMGLRLAVGHYILPRLAMVATMRMGFGGSGFMGQWMMGMRAQYLFTSLDATGFNASAFFGGSVGQIQTQPDQGHGVRDLFVSPGLGSFQVGAVLGYRFLPNFGIHVTPEVHVFVPSGTLVLDMTAGIETAF
jgi:hypothetical protein